IDRLLSPDENRLIRSAHDLANGGLAVALAECSMEGVGCHLDLGRLKPAATLDAVALLFGESQARAIVSTSQVDEVLRRAKTHGVPAARIGHTQLGMFLIERDGVPLIRATAPERARVWPGALERR